MEAQTLNFSFAIGKRNTYGVTDHVVNLKVEGDDIPEGANPFDYLRARLREELVRAESKVKPAAAPEAL